MLFYILRKIAVTNVAFFGDQLPRNIRVATVICYREDGLLGDSRQEK
jgi:hypothetical protein